MKEVKICLPAYKLIYSICFTVLLSLVRGISSISEIGITLEPYMGLLALIFCSDTYQMEYTGGRWEVFCLYTVENRTKRMMRRLLLQWGCLYLLSLAGYWFFFWQRPYHMENTSPALLYGMYVIAVLFTIPFWGTLSMTMANLFRNVWAGIGITFLLWIVLNSKPGDELLGKYNVFSFAFRDLQNGNDVSWLRGTGIACVLTVFMLVMIPVILKKRG